MPKQDKVQRINQRRARPTDALGVSGGGAFVPPGTITLTTGNTVGTTHTHALDILASWDPGAAESLLKTNPDGWLNLVRLYLDELHAELGADLVVQLGDDTGGTRLSITDSAGAEVAAVDSDGNATLRTVLPDGNNLWSLGADATRWANIWANYFEAQDASINATLDVGGPSYLSDVLPQSTGTYDLGSSVLHWRKLWVDELSGAKVGGDLIPALTDAYDLGSSAKLWRRGYLSELRAVLFAEETIQLVGGWLIVPKDAGTFAADVAALDTTIDFGKTMTPGHWVLVRSYDAVTGNPAAEYLTVGSLVSGTTYNVTRNVDGSGANNWPAGTPFLVLGTEGDGRIELNAYDTPRIQILQQGAAYNLADEVVRIGDLDGAFGITEERYGFGVGDYAAGNYLRYDPVDGFLLRAGAGEARIDGNGITIGYDEPVLRLEANSGGTIFDVIYHDADANALHLESATRYWELMESGGAKWAMDGDFVKAQARTKSSKIDLALGNAANNWANLGAHNAPGLVISVGTGATPSPAVDLREHRLNPVTDNARRLPMMIYLGAETNAGKYLNFATGVKYLWANIAAFNVTTGAAIAHLVCEIAQPSKDDYAADRWFTSDRTYLYSTSGELYLRLRYDGYAILYNTSTAKVRWVGWVMYYTA